MEPSEAANQQRGVLLAARTALVTVMLVWAAGSACAGNKAEKVKPWQHCYSASAEKWNVSERLLRAIAKVESGDNPKAVSPADAIGLMQIHSSWLRKLKSFGITRDDLFDACTNIDVGAWILSSELKVRGNSWEAVGAYNAACTKLKGGECKSQRAWYSWKVFGAMGGKTNEQVPATVRSGAQTSPFTAVAVANSENDL